MNMLFYPLVFIFGLVAGSFLNCVIYRINLEETRSPKGERVSSTSFLRGRPRRKTFSFLRGRSFCPHCKHTLGFWDLMPIISFFVLKGKCRYCEKKISWQYPIVEISTALIFLLIFNFQFSPKESLCGPTGQAIFNQFSINQFFNFQTTINLLYFWIVSALLILIFVYDLKHCIIPDKVIYPAIAITLLCKVIFNFQFSIFNQFSINQFSNFQTGNLAGSIASASAASAFFFLIWAVSRGKWLGFGDVKLAFFMGLFLGWPNILVGMFAGFFIGAIIGTGLMLLGKKKLKSQVPFGPFLVTGTFIALFWGQEIVRWYLSLI